MRNQFCKRAGALLLAAVLTVMAVPIAAFAKNSTTKFSTPYKTSTYYTKLIKAKNGAYANAGLKLAAIAESQVGYLEGRVYSNLDGNHSGGKTKAMKLSYKSGSKYKNYNGWLDTCEYNFWYYGASDNSKVTTYTSSTKKVSAATYPVSKYNKAWCAAFVSWCAAHAGLSGKIPANAGVGYLCDAVLKKGGYKINAADRQPGDLVYYYCKTCNARSHVGIVATNSRYSIEGNTDDKVKKVDLTAKVTNTCMSGHTTVRYYIRPNICSHNSTISKITTEATCTTQGVRTYYCKSCNAVVKSEIIPAKNHSYDKYHYCKSCGQFEPLKSSEVKTGVYVAKEKVTLYAAPYTKGPGGVSNKRLTISLGEAVTVHHGGTNAIGTKYYYVTYCDSNNKRTEGYVKAKSFSTKQTKFSFYEDDTKLFQVCLNGTVTIPRSSVTPKNGYFLSGFAIYRKANLSSTKRYYTDQGVWATKSQIAKKNYTVKLYAPGSTYSFNTAWIDPSNKATSHYYLEAEWEKAKTYKVTYDANGGKNAPEPQSKKQGQALTLSSVKPTRSGYTFTGWATKANGSVAYKAGAAYTKDANVTLYAVWVKNPITWDSLYAKNIKSTSALVGCTVTADASKINRIGLQLKSGNGSWKTVASWKVGSVLNYCTVQCGGSGSEISGNLTQNTQYSYRFYVETTNVGTLYSATKTFTTGGATTPTMYTVSYNANGGSGAPAAQSAAVGQTITLSSVIPTRSGYTFAGWATTAGGSVAYKAGASYTGTSSATLYAVWIKHPITWNSLYVKNIKATSALVGCTVTVDASKINRIGLQLKAGNGSWKTVASWKVGSVLDYCTVQCGGSGSEISGNLTKNTTYSYRFYVETTNVGTLYSATKTFTTKS